MNFARMREIVPLFFLIGLSTLGGSSSAKDPAKSSAGAAGIVRCCGIPLRTDFGHPERMAELALQPDFILAGCIDSGKTKGLVEAFDAYLQTVDMEFGDAASRDIVRSRLNKVFKSVANDQARSAHLLEGFRRFSFASVLVSKRLNSRAIEEVRQARASFLRAVPPDSFCLMPVELYLATSLAEAGESAEAVTISQSVVTRARAAFGPQDEFVGLSLVGLAKAQLAAGKAPKAEESLREAMGILAESLEIQPGAYLMNCSVLGETLVAQSKNAETAELMAYLDPQIRTMFRNQPVPPVFDVVTMRAKALVALKRYEEAEKALGRFPELIQSLREPGEAGRNLLEVYVTLLERTDRDDETAPIRKMIARIDAKKPLASRKPAATERN